MKKLIISISAALILFSSALFLLQENIVPLKSGKIKDVIGRNVEQKYFEKTDVMIFGLKRFIAMTDKKISFLLKSIDPDWTSSKGGEVQLRLFFADFVNSDPYCKRIRIVNTGLEILFSTAPQDIPRSRLNVGLYGSLFKEQPPYASRIVVDPIAEMLVFYKVIAGKKGERFAVLFYYSQDALEGVFEGIDDPKAKSFLITSGKIILVNFPEIDESEQANLAKLVQAIGQNESGALRIIMKGMDKTVYYRRLSGQYADWTMGLTLDTERLHISRIGVLILVVQALVIVSVFLFVLFSLSRRRTSRGFGPERGGGGRTETPDSGVRAPAGATGPEGGVAEQGRAAACAEPASVRADAAGSGTPSAAGPGEEAHAETAPLETAPPTAAAPGVMSLSDIEELVDVEEIGEAEVAQAAEDFEEAVEAEAFGPDEPEELPGEVEELVGAGEPGPAEGTAAEPDISLPFVGGVEGPGTGFAEEVEELGELEEAEVAAPVGEPAEPRKDEEIVDDMGDAGGRKIGERVLPELEALVLAGNPDEEGEEATEVEAPPVIPEEVYREQGKVNHEDELSALITEIESDGKGDGGGEGARGEEPEAFREREVLSKPAALQEAETLPEPDAHEERERPPGVRHMEQPPVFTEPETAPDFEDLPDLRSPEGLSLFMKGVLKTVGVTKGALLARSEGGRFEPRTIFGFSKGTKRKLVFDGGESVYADFLGKGKTLFILEKPFRSREVAKKFDRADSAKIRSLVMSPVVKEGVVKSVLVAGVSKGKKIDKDEVIDKIKKIKEVIARVY